MTPRERVMAVLNHEEPDKIPIMAFDFTRIGSQGGWLRRLIKRGLGVTRLCHPYKPSYRGMNFYLEDVKYTETRYIEKGIIKFRDLLETPVGSVTSVTRINPIKDVQLLFGA